MGHSAIKQHNESKLHKQKTSATFFVKKNSHEELKVILMETTKIFQSYNSLDCSFKLDTKIYSKVAPKLSCGRTKSQAFVQNVLASMALEKPIKLLRQYVQNFSLVFS